MHSHTKFSLLLSGIISSQAFAATFSAPDYFEVMYVNREKPSLIDDMNTFELNAGQHELILRYKQDIESFKEEESFRSEPIIIDINIDGDDKLKLQPAKHPEQFWQAEAYAKKPDFNITNQQNTIVDYQSYLLPLKPGFQWGRDYLQEVTEFKAIQNSKVNEAKVASLEAQLAKSPKKEPSKQVTDELETLKNEYNQAAPATQIAYRLWIIDRSIIAKQQTEKLKRLKQLHSQASTMTQREIQIWMIK